MQYIKTQKELDELCKVGVKAGEEFTIEGEGMRLNVCISVFGFLEIKAELGTDWAHYVVAWESSHVVAWESSHVEARGSSHVEAWESSHVVARGSVASWIYSVDATIELFGWSVAYQLFEGKGKIKKERKTATVIKIPEQKGTLTDYEDRYPIVKKGTKFLFYKAVHKKKDGTYYSDYSNSFTYEVGRVYEHKCAPASNGACSVGLHISFKSWARSFGINWNDCAILECEVEKKDLVISKDTDGKVRCKKLKVIRELPESEWYD